MPTGNSIDLSLWQRATDRNDVFDTNLIPEATAGPLSDCRVVWIITQADSQGPRTNRTRRCRPGPLFGGTPAFSVPRDLGFRLLERWQFNLVQVIKAATISASDYQTRIQSTSMSAGKVTQGGIACARPTNREVEDWEHPVAGIVERPPEVAGLPETGMGFGGTLKYGFAPST